MRAGGGLRVGTLGRLARVLRVGEQGDPANAGDELAQQLEALAVQLEREIGQARHAGVRPGQALGKAGRDRIAAVRVDDRHGQLDRLDLEHRFALDDDQVDRQADQLVGERAHSGDVVVAVAEVDRQVAALGKAELGERGAERLDVGDEAGRPLRRQPADAGGAALALGGSEPWQHAQRGSGKDELASFHGRSSNRQASLGFTTAATEVCTPSRCQSSLPAAERRHRLVEALEDELARRLGRDQVFERRADALRDQDLAALRFAAQPRRQVGDGADRAVVDAPLEADAADASRSPARCRRPCASA